MKALSLHHLDIGSRNSKLIINNESWGRFVTMNAIVNTEQRYVYDILNVANVGTSQMAKIKSWWRIDRMTIWWVGQVPRKTPVAVHIGSTWHFPTS